MLNSSRTPKAQRSARIPPFGFQLLPPCRWREALRVGRRKTSSTGAARTDARLRCVGGPARGLFSSRLGSAFPHSLDHHLIDTLQRRLFRLGRWAGKMRLIFRLGRDWLGWQFGHSAWNSVLALGLWHVAARTAIRQMAEGPFNSQPGSTMLPSPDEKQQIRRQ